MFTMLDFDRTDKLIQYMPTVYFTGNQKELY